MEYTFLEIYTMIQTTQVNKILVVDDDKDIVRLVRAYLEQSGFSVDTAYDGGSAMQKIRAETPQLIVLDLMLPDTDGWEITRTVRADPKLAALPIIMLTARADDVDKIVGLEIGADDYITKPFNPREVVARVRTVLRRMQTNGQTTENFKTLRSDALIMDIGRHEVLLDGQPIELTQTEFKLLQLLMENEGYAFTRSELVEKALGYEYDGLDRTLDSHIKNLRKKVETNPKEPRYIQTIYGVGYRFT